MTIYIIFLIRAILLTMINSYKLEFLIFNQLLLNKYHFNFKMVYNDIISESIVLYFKHEYIREYLAKGLKVSLDSDNLNVRFCMHRFGQVSRFRMDRSSSNYNRIVILLYSRLICIRSS